MKFNEGQINPADAKEVFKVASGLREKPSAMQRIPGLRRDKIDISTLQKAWSDAGYPDDTRDLAVILKQQGFKPKEINKVFKEVFGDEDSTKTGDAASPTIQKIADYAKEHNLVEPLKAFLQQEYKFTESYAYEGKAVVEDIRHIFTSIVQEERGARTELIKQEDMNSLGRTRK